MKTCNFLPFLIFIAITSVRPDLSAQPVKRCGVVEVNVSRREHNVSRVWTLNNDILKVPVVVHVVFSRPEENISKEQVLSQIAALNRDFRKKNPDTVDIVAQFSGVSADCRIEFALVSKDEHGNPFDGITRTETTHGVFANDDIHLTSSGGKDAWDATKYLNIWVCNLATGILGYASSPGTEAFKDGIVIHYSNFGSLDLAPPYNKGRTTTHEIGHYLGLRHLWGNNGGCGDDGIYDTPVQSGYSTGCSLTRNTCGNLNMVQNYMDFSDDDCMCLFTNGQKEVMRNTLLNQRFSLIENAEIIPGVESGFVSQILIYPSEYQSHSFWISSKTPLSTALIGVFNAQGRNLNFELTKEDQYKYLLEVKDCNQGIHFLAIQQGKTICRRKILIE